MNNETPNEIIIIEVEILDDGYSAKDKRGEKYRIESINMGAGHYKKTVRYDRYFLKERTECRAQLLENGKLNILQSI